MTLRIGLIIYPGFQALDIAALTVFEMANKFQGDKPYELAMLSLDGGPVRSSVGVVMDSSAMDSGGYDTLMIAGATSIPPDFPALEAKLKDVVNKTRRISSICTGSFILAKVGLLNGKRATTHWMYGGILREMYSDIRVDEDMIVIKDGNIWSSAGVTACMDLALALVEADLGIDVAKSIARMMLVNRYRVGGQLQFSVLTNLEPSADRIKSALVFAKENLRKDLTVDDLANHARWSKRHFSRIFHSQTGLAPAKAIEKLRVEAAQKLIEEGNSSVIDVAMLTGFGDEERMRRAFVRTLGQPPAVFMSLAKSCRRYVHAS